MRFDCSFRIYDMTTRKLFKIERVSVIADDEEDAIWQFSHGVLDNVPLGCFAIPDLRTLKRFKSSSF